MIKKFLLLISILVLASISVNAFGVDIYEVGAEYMIINFTDVNLSNLQESYTPHLENDTLVIDKEFKLEDGVEDDLFFPIAVIKTKGASNVPALNTWTLDFDDNTMEQAYLSMQLPHAREADSELEPHFHWQTEDDTAGDVVWCLEVQRANIGEAFNPVPMTQCTVSASLEDSTKHIMSSEMWLNGTGMTASAMGKLRIYRNATDVRDTYAADAMLMQFDVHIKIDKFGAEP